MGIEQEVVRRATGPTIAPARIVIARTRHLGWEGLRAVLREWPSISVIADVTGAEQAVRAVRQHRPECVMAAVDLEGASIVTLAEQLRESSPSSRLMVFNDELDHVLQGALEAANVYSYLLWRDVTREGLYWTVGCVLQAGLRVASPAAVDELAARAERQRRERLESLRLTEREWAVLRGLVAGRTRKQIARAEHVSLRTVGRIIARLEAKFEVRNVRALVARAVEWAFDNDEIGDKCVQNDNPITYSSALGTYYNHYWYPDYYMIQNMWSNLQHACVQSGP